MKYAIIVYKRKGIVNIGDDMQLLAIKELYDRIGVSFDSLVKIDFYNLTNYDDEEVVLPICFPFYGYNDKGVVTCFSPKIHPLFLSLSLRYPYLPETEIEYLKQNGPIGCRDGYTCDGLKKVGVDAYLNGCMTLTLNKRPNGLNNKIFCVDVKPELIEIIRKKYKDEIVISSHIYSDNNFDSIELANKLLIDYSANAKVVITSKMHCALPCLAMGLPVIFVPNNFDSRFTWLEDIIHVYPPEEWNDIDWNPQPADISQYRELMVKVSTKRLLQKDFRSEINTLEELYSKRTKRDYSIEAFEFLKKWVDNHWCNINDDIDFVMWGAHQCSSLLLDYIKMHYPNAHFTDFVDTYKRIEFHGLRSKKIEEVNNIKKKYIIVGAATAARYAKLYAEENNISKDMICIYYTNGIL